MIYARIIDFNQLENNMKKKTISQREINRRNKQARKQWGKDNPVSAFCIRYHGGHPL